MDRRLGGRPTAAHESVWDSASLPRWERTSLDKPAHAHSLLPLVRKAGGSWAPSPFFLTAHPVRSSCPTPSPACPWKVPGDTQGARADGHLLCVTLSGLGHLLFTPRRSEGNRQIKSFTRPVPITSIPRGEKKKKKQNKNKKIFCTEIYFYYTKFVQYQKKTGKMVYIFFSLL